MATTSDNQSVFALDPVTGVRVWNFVEPYNAYDRNPQETDGGDDDFGSSPVLAEVPSPDVKPAACPGSAGSTGLVIEGSKDGYVYGLCEATGATVWSDQIAQAGQLDQAIVGSIGGYIASASLGAVNGKAALFFVAAWPLPFTNAGIFTKGDTNVASCPGAILNKLPLLPACPDLSLLTHPSRLFGLAAVDAGTGKVDWRTTALPTAAATTYTNGVVFSPQALAFGIVAYNANSGAPLWAFPIGAAPSSGAAIAGSDRCARCAATCHDPEPIRRAGSISWKYRMAASTSRSSPVASTQRSITAGIGGFQAAAERQRRSGK